MRLNVYLQRAGIGSRREAERLVAESRVKINGATALATTPVEDGDTVLVDGRAVASSSKALPRLFKLNKPVDFLVTNRDPQGRPTVFDLPSLKPPSWPRSNPRVMSVGRLDVNSEGLLLLSSDGPLAQAMMNPANALRREYRVRVRGRLSPLALESLKKGVSVEGVNYRGIEVAPEAAEPSAANIWYRIVLVEGKNREIRKLMEYFGCVVNRLIRTQYGPIKLEGLARGNVAEVSPAEVKRLMRDLRLG